MKKTIKIQTRRFLLCGQILMLAALVLTSTGIPVAATAQNREIPAGMTATAQQTPLSATRWTLVPGVTSAGIALTGQWHMKTSNALRWSDGRCALITYWATREQKTRYLRCIDYMDANFHDTANSCYQPTGN